MSLSIVKRPQGNINSSMSAIGTYTNGSTTITNVSHGLSTGNFIYITNNQAVGFWYVTIFGADTFTISEYSGATNYSFIGSGTFTYYASVSTHGWNAVHLPIVYKLTSSIWPTNSVDTARTVSSYANDNGYVKLTLSGAIKSDVTELEFVKVTYVGGITAIYQIIAWYSTSIVTINLAYVLGITFSTVQYYYNNYHARIRVYSGIQSGHIYALQKPIELITEQKIIPDSNSVITFNIAEFIKQKLDILKNDLLKGTLQNNIDAWTQFYITYAEGYDYSQGGYTLLDFVGSYTDDSSNFIGYAINADLPFKNTYSGFMSDYIFGSSSVLAKFLTTSQYPEITEDEYFDISLIVDSTYSDIALVQELYSNSILQQTIYNSLTTTNNYGIYRFPLTKLSSEDTQKIYLLKSKLTLSAPSAWADDFGSWDTKDSVSFSKTGIINGIGQIAVSHIPFIVNAGTRIQIDIALIISSFSSSSGFGYFDLSFYLADGSNNIISQTRTYSTGNGQYNSNYSGIAISEVIIPDITSARLVIRLAKQDAAASLVAITLQTFTVGYNDRISETKTLTINSECSPFIIYNICWLNNLGGFEWKCFRSSSDLGVNIESTKTVNKNIFQNWPNSFGEGADTIKQETSRNTRQTITLRAENQTSDQIQDLFRIKTSPLVQIVNSANDKRTIIPDSGSFVYYKQRDKLFNFEFTAEFTDNLPSQAL